jgi:hypothetical protein
MIRETIFALLLASPMLATVPSFRVEGTDAGPWRKIFASVNIQQSEQASIIVLGPGSKSNGHALAQDHIVIFEATGFPTEAKTVSVRQIRDTHAPDVQIIWEHPQTIPFTTLPSGYNIYASERWQNVPVLAGKRTWHGAILWTATQPGASGYERYPYLLHALADLGLEFPAQSNSLWAFFDSSYRIRADVDYLAKRWRSAGIAALQVAAWHNMDDDPAQDAYLRKLIEACHRNAILVYAWLELPHVSEKFWNEHPEWREKTALGQDAQLDWRKLMNLQNPDCRAAAAREITAMLEKFDWDGVNLAELYFESLEGASNPARFTPMNDDVRAEYKEVAGFDPRLLFDKTSPYSRDADSLKKFLTFRAVLASRMQSDWLKELDAVRREKPFLDSVLTHIDDRFDPGIRDELGADIARALPLMRAYRSTLLVEDPATLWDRGPERYKELASKYQDDVAVDVNVVDRYQDVYPTKKQTGVELLELVHQASTSFGKVALYGENSIYRHDLAILPAAAADITLEQPSPDEVKIASKNSVRIPWTGIAEVDGKTWPIQNANSVEIPAGKHRLLAGVVPPAFTITDFNGEIRSAAARTNCVTISYSARTRAIAVPASAVSGIDVDGQTIPASSSYVMLPAGQHVVTFTK